MELVLELTRQNHKIARLDNQGIRHYFDNRDITNNNSTEWEDLALPFNNNFVFGRLALLYAQKMNLVPQLLHPFQQFLDLKINKSTTAINRKYFPIIQALGKLLKKIKREAEIQFGKKAKCIDIQFQQLEISSIHLKMFLELLSALHFPLRAVHNEKEVLFSSQDDSIKLGNYSNTTNYAIGISYHKPEEDIVWKIEKGENYTDRIKEFITPISKDSSLYFYIKNANNSIKKLGIIPLKTNKSSRIELNLTYTALEELYVDVIDWDSGIITNQYFMLESAFKRQFLLLHSFLKN